MTKTCERCGRPKWRQSRRRLCDGCDRRDRFRGAYAAQALAWLGERDRRVEEMQKRAAEGRPLFDGKS